MINSKVIDTIRTFNQNEFKTFGKFVSSPYFNNSKSTVKLYDFIKKFYPDFSKLRFTKENAYHFLFPGQKYNGGTLRKYFSDMQSLAEEFMALSNLEKNSFPKKLALLNELAEKKLDKMFLLKIGELDNINRQGNNFDDDYFKNNFELEVSRLNFYLGLGRAGFAPQTVFKNLQKCTTYLISYALIASFKLNQDLSVISISSDSDKTNTLVFKFLQSLGPEKFLDIFKSFAPEYYPVIAIYFSRFMILSGYDANDEYYRKSKELILKNLKRFTRFEKYNLMLFLENSCDEKIYANKSFHSELHDIHKMMLSTGLYKSEDSDYFSLIRFRKMLKISLSLHEYKWAENFINKYLSELPKEFQNNMYFYSEALLYFSKMNFDKSLENISKVKSEVYIFKFDVLVLKLQCEFELKYFEEAYYSLDSIKHLLKSDTTSPKWMKSRLSGFLRYFNYLLKTTHTRVVQLKYEFVPFEKLINEIKNSSQILEKEWLLDKFNEKLEEVKK